ncbi:phospholipid-binding lipoprotein MlaA [uncultured Gammaproteobacteria bacterium]
MEKLISYASSAVICINLALCSPVLAAEGDPLESFNRSMFGFNTLAIKYAIGPAADFLDTWIPDGIKRMGGNIYSNMIEPEFIATNLFRGNNQDAGVSAARFAINTTLGLVGAFDVAQTMGYNRREIEFGEGMCGLGVPAGPFVVLPLIGPTNIAHAGILTGFFTVEWYVLSLISSLLATADLVVDLSASAASLRYAGEQPDGTLTDPYQIQRAEYAKYIGGGCSKK